jgi:3-oxoacyl-[acyl-carrier protein] reductase
MNVMYDLRGRTAIVTGAAKGIGKAIAELLAASGAHVTVWDVMPVKRADMRSTVVDVTDRAQIATPAISARPIRSTRTSRTTGSASCA